MHFMCPLQALGGWKRKPCAYSVFFSKKQEYSGTAAAALRAIQSLESERAVPRMAGEPRDSDARSLFKEENIYEKNAESKG